MRTCVSLCLVLFLRIYMEFRNRLQLFALYSILIGIIHPVMGQKISDSSNYEYLDAVVVSSNKEESKLKNNVLGISILKPYLIENKITTNFSTGLQQVSGITVNDDQINIRNGSGWSYGAGSRVMVCVDEMPMITGDAGSVPFSYLPTEAIGNVEVIKSAGSVVYGSSALNGVINLRTKDIPKKGFGEVNIIAGTYDVPNQLKYRSKRLFQYGINGYFGKQIRDHSYIITWNQLNDDGYRQSDFDNRLRIGARYVYNPNWLPQLKLHLNGQIQKGESGSFLIWRSDTFGYNTQNNSVTKTLGTRFNIDPKITWNGKIWNHTFQNRFFKVVNDIDNGDPNNNQDNKSDFYYSEWRSARYFGKYLKTTLGAVNTFTTTESPLFGGTHKAQNHAGYLQLNYKRFGWVFEGGSRFEYFKLDEKQRSRPVFRAGVNKQLARGTFLRASYGEGYRFPSMAELFTATSSGGVSVLPNPDLEPESSKSVELGLKQGIKFGKVQGYLDFAGFYTRLSNLMEYTFGNWAEDIGFPNFGFKSFNISESEIKGVEIETGGKISLSDNSSIMWFGGYTYSVPTVSNPDSAFTYMGFGTAYPVTFANTRSDETDFMKYRNRHVVRFDVQADIKDISMAISYRFASGFENVDKAFLNDVLIPGAENQYRNGAISGHVFDLRLSRKITKSTRINAQIRNITQRIYMGRPADLSAPRQYQLQLVHNF